MKIRLIGLSIAFWLATSASANLTSFQWVGGAAGTVNPGDQIVTLAGDAQSIVGDGGWVDLSQLLSFPVLSVDTVIIAPPFIGGTWSSPVINGDASYVGPVSAVIDNDGFFEVGETWGFGAVAMVVDLQPDSNSAPEPTQLFDPNSIIMGSEVPEPSSIALMALAGGGSFLLRRKKSNPIFP